MKAAEATASMKRRKPAGVPALIPQAHGGALLSGGIPGHPGAGGRPKEEVREKLVYIASEKGVAFLTSLMDGEVDVRHFGTCTQCGHREALPADGDYMRRILEEVGDKANASVDQRLKALDTALRYGVGTRDEIDVKNHPEVQAFMQRFAQATVEVVGEEQYKKIGARINQLAAK